MIPHNEKELGDIKYDAERNCLGANVGDTLRMVATIAELRAEVERLRDKYQRDVFGLNNEGDPIGGEPAGGYANDNARLRAELDGERNMAARHQRTIDRLKRELDALWGQEAAFRDCIQSLHDEMLNKFGGQKPEDMHPVTRREYDRDMAEIAEYRAALAAPIAKEQGEKVEPRKTWRAGNPSYLCHHCGTPLMQHEQQVFCPRGPAFASGSTAPSRQGEGEDA